MTASPLVNTEQIQALERSLIGSIIIDSDAISEIEDIGISPDDFFDGRYGIILRHVLELRNFKRIVDLVSLTDSLSKTNDIYKIGGPSFILDICQDVASSANIRYYAERVKDESLSRIVFNKAQEIIGFTKENLTREELLEKVNFLVGSLNNNQSKGNGLEIRESILSVIKDLRERDSVQSSLTKTGFLSIDEKIEGLTPGQLVILAARPSIGKTSLALNIGKNVTETYNEHVLIFSFEMTHKELTERIVSAEALVEGKKFKSKEFNHEELLRIGRAAEKCSELKLIIDDSTNSTVQKIRNRALRYKSKHGKLRMVIIDYLQLIPSHREMKNRTRSDELGEITRSLKLLSKELECPILCLSQLNRGVESRENRRPLLSDLRDSGSIEQDADMVWFIYRDDFYNSNNKKNSEAEIIVSKNRGGETGTVKLRWIGEFTRFSEIHESF